MTLEELESFCDYCNRYFSPECASRLIGKMIKVQARQ